MDEILAGLLAVIASGAASSAFAEIVKRRSRDQTQDDRTAALEMSTDASSAARRLASLADQMEQAIEEARTEVSATEDRQRKLEAEAKLWEQRASEARSLAELTEEQSRDLRKLITDAAREPFAVKARWFVASVVASAVLGAILGVIFTQIFIGPG